MITRRQLLSATAIVAIGLLQAWDSRAFTAGPLVTAMALAAVAVPALVALCTTRPAIHGLAIVATGVLAFGARIVSPTPLPELGLLVLIAALALLAPALFDRARVSAGG
jgi:hypothetical protein